MFHHLIRQSASTRATEPDGPSRANDAHGPAATANKPAAPAADESNANQSAAANESNANQSTTPNANWSNATTPIHSAAAVQSQSEHKQSP